MIETGACQGSKPKEIYSSFEKMEKDIEELTEKLKFLFERLNPIMNPSFENQINPPIPERNKMCSISNRMEESIAKIEILIGHIGTLSEYLQI